jgi:cytochrome P450 family 4
MSVSFKITGQMLFSELLERLLGTTKLWGRRVGINRMWNGSTPYVLLFHPDRVEV